MDKKTELTEIKKNSVGNGLLIEHDGYISLSDNQHLNEAVITSNENKEWHVPYPFVVSAVFQKYGLKNANGRIYPESVLKKQVELYQTRINERRAYGECYTPDVLILTENGWKTLNEVKEGENILTLNTETNNIEIKPILKKIEYDYDGDMIHIKGRNIDDLVTPNHRFPLYKARKFDKFYTAEEIMDNDKLSNHYIPKVNEWTYLKELNIETNSIFFNNSIKKEKEYYNGKVMCVEVENHTWFVMSNNKCHWTCNCNHPSDSTIDLGRISHNIIELHWEGRTLVGKMELNISEGFRKYGIASSLGDTVAQLLLNGYKIGVSSRGIGNVEQDKLGQYIVTEFELICWDVVSDPSTPLAYISSDEKALQPYIEGISKENNTILEKIDKINKILVL